MLRATFAAVALALPVLALPAHAAKATLKDAKGEKVGMVLLVEEAGGVTLSVKVRGLAPGRHGIHVHAVGKCEGPDFQSAGPHFNPAGKKHGLKNPEGHHLGDLPNLEVGADGTGEAKLKLPGAALDAGASGLFGPQGTAVVIHEKADDEASDPAGNSGPRIACGAITHGG